MSIKLTQDFDNAAQNLEKMLPNELLGCMSCVLPFNICAVRPLHIQQWKRKPEENNCYNFALALLTNDYLQPGELFIPEKDRSGYELRKKRTEAKYGDDIQAYADIIIRGALLDGLISLGDQLECEDQSYPVALFFRDREEAESNDFHWYAPRIKEEGARRRIVWAHKSGENPPEVLGEGHSIFQSAHDKGYKHFAGYFSVHSNSFKMTRRAHNIKNNKFIYSL